MISRELCLHRVDQTVVIDQQTVTLVQKRREELCNRMFACTREPIDPYEGPRESRIRGAHVEKCASIKLGAKGSGLRQEQIKAANDGGVYTEGRLMFATGQARCPVIFWVVARH